MRCVLRGVCTSTAILLVALGFPQPGQAQDFPPDLTADIAWSAGTTNVADIQAAFNNARAAENAQLGTSLPAMVMPTQSEWNAKSNGEKTLWLVNSERTARGVLPLQGVDPNVTGVAQNYANYLLANNAFSHTANGLDPWQRLDLSLAINGHHDFLGVSENIFAFVTSGTSIALPVERSVYGWIFDDSSSGWGHRHALLWRSFANNYGSPASEGLMGLGRASGGPWSGFGSPWNFAEIMVFNVFDPDSTYVSGADTDGDGNADNADNCMLLANPGQLDADADGYGNLCDADLNNSGTVTTADFGLLRSLLGQAAGVSAAAAAADMNGSGTVTTADFGLLRARLGTMPGPSGLACAGTVPCP